MAGGDPGDVEIAGGAIGEANREARPVVVLDGLEGVADCHLGVADDMAEGQRPLRDHGGQLRAGDLGDWAAEELGGVGEVAAEIGQRTGPGPTAVAPGDRGLRVGAVVGPVLGVDVDRLAKPARGDLGGDRRDARGAAEREPDPGHDPGGLDGLRHRLGVSRRRRQRLLTQDVLPCMRERFDDLPVQMVGHHHADRVDVVGGHDVLPAGVAASEPVPASGVGRQPGVDVGDRHQTNVREPRVEHGLRRTVAVCVGSSSHAGSDDGDADAVDHGVHSLCLSGLTSAWIVVLDRTSST